MKRGLGRAVAGLAVLAALVASWGAWQSPALSRAWSALLSLCASTAL